MTKKKDDNVYLSKSETSLMINDILKILTVIIIYNLMICIIDNEGDFLDENTLKLMLYITVGMIIYYVVVSRAKNYFGF